MKLTDYALIFILVFICFSLGSDTKMQINGQVLLEQQNYNRALDTAVSDSMFMLVEVDNGEEIQINVEKAMDTFFRSICVNLGININEENMTIMKTYIPVMIFLLDDCYVIVKHNYEKDDALQIMEPQKYMYEDERYTYYFHLSDKLTIVDGDDEIEGDFEGIGIVYEDSLAANIQKYEQKKSQVIIDLITNELEKCTNEEYINSGNENWNFYIPYGEDDMWNRTINDIGLIAVFSGFPYSKSSLGYYSKFAFGGSRIWKRE